jgi:hypothetical protein
MAIRTIESPSAVEDTHDILLRRDAFERLANLGTTAQAVRITRDMPDKVISSMLLPATFSWRQRNGEQNLVVDSDGRFPAWEPIAQEARTRGNTYTLEIAATAPDMGHPGAVYLGANGKLTRTDRFLDVLSSKGRHPDICFSVNLLADFLEAIDTKTPVFLEFNGSDAPIYCHALDRTFEYILMPLSRD